MKKRKIFIYGVLTCNRRKLDAWKLQQYFLKNNYTIVNNPKDADIILLSTCAYSNKHAETSLETTKKFLDYDAELIVSGCLPEIEKEELAKIFDGKTISTKTLSQIDEIFPENKVKFNNIDDANIPLENSNEYVLISNLKKVFGKSHITKKIVSGVSESIIKNVFSDESAYSHRSIINYAYFKYFKERLQPSLTFHKDSYFIRPSWGCLGNCSYCVIKNAIGPLKSKPLDTITAEFKNGLNLGYKNFIFDSDDLGAYGVDIGSNYTEMLKEVTDIPGEYKVHLRYVHPRWIVKHVDDFNGVLKKGKIQSIECAIQSGCPRILKLMHRFPDVERIASVFSVLKETSPNLLLSTECINGFPTETKEDFEATLNCVKDIDFDWGFIFPFSCRPESEAEKLEPKISKTEILDRMSYAKEYLKENGYDSSIFKNLNILAFSKISTGLKLDNGAKSFCFSTIE